MPVADQKGMSVADNLARIKETIGDRPVKLIAVTKTAKPAQIEEAYGCGVTEFGESRIQDALTKLKVLPPQVVSTTNWHFIGHLQTNKVKQAIGKFVLIHSVDSLHLAQEISKVAVSLSMDRQIVQPILLQVKVAEDPGKSGFSAAQLRAQFSQIFDLPNLKIEGLMTIAPLTEDKNVWRQCFEGLRNLRDELEKQHGVNLRELSMGMSTDWQEAINCGATMVRIGTAIFKE
jgi:pyridoxal phosphate enzyme (YggS family)